MTFSFSLGGYQCAHAFVQHINEFAEASAWQLPYTVGGTVNWCSQLVQKNSMEVPQKTKNRVITWPSKSTLGHISWQNYNSERYIYHYLHSSTIYNSQVMFIDRWMDKDVIYKHTHRHRNTVKPWKKNTIIPFVAMWIDLEIFILCEVSQKEKDKCHIMLLLRGI